MGIKYPPGYTRKVIEVPGYSPFVIATKDDDAEDWVIAGLSPELGSYLKQMHQDNYAGMNFGQFIMKMFG